MNAIELSHLTTLLDALQSDPRRADFTLGFVAAPEISKDMLEVVVRLWTAYVNTRLLEEIRQVRTDFL